MGAVLPDKDDGGGVLDEQGFHAKDAEISLDGYVAEDWIAFGVFWALALVVFYQFFTRYALNNSASWTEEIARYLLVGVVFIGSSAAVRKNTHIHVEFLYRYMPAQAGRVLATCVDVIRIVFLAACFWYSIQLLGPMHNQRMSIVDLPMSLVYGAVTLGFGAMAVRAVMLAIVHWKQGYTSLERPETAY